MPCTAFADQDSMSANESDVQTLRSGVYESSAGGDNANFSVDSETAPDDNKDDSSSSIGGGLFCRAAVWFKCQCCFCRHPCRRQDGAQGHVRGGTAVPDPQTLEVPLLHGPGWQALPEPAGMWLQGGRDEAVSFARGGPLQRRGCLLLDIQVPEHEDGPRDDGGPRGPT